MSEEKRDSHVLLTADEKIVKIAAKIFRLMKEENLTYREAMEALSVCEVILKEKCVLGD